MNRLTERRTAEVLRQNSEGLMSKGLDVPIDDLRYIKLADYENAEEETTVLYLCDPEKNTKCTKESCYLSGGDCMQTSNINFRRKIQ